ncbi:hypothetical protein GMPD_23800 [Geomonas paludis]|uniref:Uncharacterized protein n=1 Tax=Geomonas paludis TaxID=2740185 RepID=A0A6V8MWK8_9BACT|nr:hypothetical protein GMPD_23800 [Geomonas paludis]
MDFQAVDCGLGFGRFRCKGARSLRIELARPHRVAPSVVYLGECDVNENMVVKVW